MRSRLECLPARLGFTRTRAYGFPMGIRTVVVVVLLIDQFVLMPFAIHRLVSKTDLGPKWLAAIPIADTTFVPRLADASPFAWLLLFIPLVNLYVWWDWWSEIAYDRDHRHGDLWALGMLVPVLDFVLLIRFANHWPRSRKVASATA